ncbi:unnamed protein product [Chrysoparadoxa australica]
MEPSHLEAALHSYLGDVTSRPSPPVLHGEPGELDLPLLGLQGVVLFPGEVLPLRISDPAFVNLAPQTTHIGVMNLPDVRSFTLGGILNVQGLEELVIRRHGPIIGTAAEITGGDHKEGGYAAITKGKQRIRISNNGLRRVDGVLRCRVTVLFDKVLPSLADPYQVNWPLRVPREAYLQYDPAHILKRAQEVAGGLSSELLAGFPTSSLPSSSSSQPEVASGHGSPQRSAGLRRSRVLVKPRASVLSQVSFWIAANIPLDDGTRQSLLDMDSPIQRLRAELELPYTQHKGGPLTDARTALVASSVVTLALLHLAFQIHHMDKLAVEALRCMTCGNPFASTTAQFRVPGAAGTLGAYVNPGGIVHQTITLRNVWRGSVTLDHHGPVEEDTWFPGYAWRGVFCRTCGQHLGWQFTSVRPAREGEVEVAAKFIDARFADNAWPVITSYPPAHPPASTNSRSITSSYSLSSPLQLFWGITRSSLCPLLDDAEAAPSQSDYSSSEGSGRDHSGEDNSGDGSSLAEEY